jgi:predicted DNA-binding transcriptional regulator YafY
MNQLAILRRHLCILRQVQPPFHYPKKQQLLERLEQEGLEASPRTFERNQQEIENYYGIRVRYCHRHRGYFLDQPADEDLSDFRQFLRLLERCERLAFLTHSTDALSTGRYLLLEDNQAMLSLQHLPVLWEALRTQRQLAFRYQAFQSDIAKSYQVDPLVLLEYRNRWYLAAWDPKEDRFKTFGLERMQEPALTATPVSGDRRSQFLALKEAALGVFVSPEDEVERIVLRIQAAMAPYIRTVPIHQSQKILDEDETGLLVELQLIVNPELERELLSYGEQLEVLEPEHLREKIRARAEKLLETYLKINPAL